MPYLVLVDHYTRQVSACGTRRLFGRLGSIPHSA